MCNEDVLFFKEQTGFEMRIRYWSSDVCSSDLDEHINVAVSDSPLGPFVQEEHAPMLETKAIDNHLFFDDDGTPYIYFVNFKDGLEVWMAEMSPDLLSIKKETMKFCIRPQQPWEKKEGSVNERPYVLKHQGLNSLIYSGTEIGRA